MRIGCPKEIKTHEYRVGLVPAAAAELIRDGHEVVIQTGAGAGIGAGDEAYEALGCRLATDAASVFDSADLIVKVKEPQAAEIALLKRDQTLFTYLHLAADPQQAHGLMERGVTAIAYETVTDVDGRLPLLHPMSEIAGRMSIQVGAAFLQKAQGGRGVLLGGVPGVPAADVLILGAGTAGWNAAQIAVGMRARVTVMDTNVVRLQQLDREFGGRVQTIASSRAAVEEAVRSADLVVGAVLIAGASAPKIISRAMLKTMRPGAVLVDISIDQGGCFETSRATTHEEPVYEVDGIVHYCVANMPGAVARTSAFALGNVTLPFILALADKGVRGALLEDPHLAAGLNVYDGGIVHPAVAGALGLSAQGPSWLS
jgi:alanine dehydrogenase